MIDTGVGITAPQGRDLDRSKERGARIGATTTNGGRIQARSAQTPALGLRIVASETTKGHEDDHLHRLRLETTTPDNAAHRQAVTEHSRADGKKRRRTSLRNELSVSQRCRTMLQSWRTTGVADWQSWRRKRSGSLRRTTSAALTGEDSWVKCIVKAAQ